MASCIRMGFIISAIMWVGLRGLYIPATIETETRKPLFLLELDRNTCMVKGAVQGRNVRKDHCWLGRIM